MRWRTHQIKVGRIGAGYGEQDVAAERGLVKVALAHSLLDEPDPGVFVENGATLTAIEEVLLTCKRTLGNGQTANRFFI